MGAVQFAEFVETSTPALLGRARALTADPHDAWDLVQETLVRVGERWDSLDEPGAYSRTVMTRLNIDRIRRIRRELDLRHRLGAPAREPDGAGGVVADGPEAWLVDALRTLTPQQRTAVALRYLDDLGLDDIAAQLHCRPGTARSHLSRGLERLRTAAGRLETLPSKDTP